MPTTYTNGLKLPDLGSIDWFNAYKNNIDILDPIVGTVNGVATTYAPISHSHSASEITSGTIDIARLPPAALERLHIVADQTARYALTTSTIQEGDTVKQADTGIMYLVVDATKLNSADGYTEYSAGTASKAIADEDGTNIKTGYVNVAGNQTVTGQKTWSGNQFFTSPMYPKNTSYEIGNTPASNVAIPIYFTDKNNVYTSYIRSVVLSSGRTMTDIVARNKFTNGALSPTGTDVSSTLQVDVQPTGTKTIYWDGLIRNDVTPYMTNNNSLGSSTNQWSSVYAQTYYYNGTQWGLDQANVWSGYNTFTNYITSQESTAIPAGGYGKGIAFRDYQNNRFGYIQPYLTPTSEKRLLIGVDSGDIASNSNIIPNANNAVNLGSSSYQWSSVYAQTYYYNGTAWGLNKDNVWSGINIFTDVIAYKDTVAEIGNYPASNRIRYQTFADKNGTTLGYTNFAVATNGVTSWNLWLENKATNGALSPTGTQVKSFMGLYIDTDMSSKLKLYGDFIPNNTSRFNLGTSTNKWKTLNGINPGALSLPSDGSNGVEIDRTNWVYDGVTSNKYTPVVDGWLLIRCTDAAGNFIFAASDGKVVSTSGTGLITSVVFGLNVLLPVRANKECDIRINCSGSKTAYFYPCLGNV